jgi:ribosome-binding protein aMBF1 (putative translation factor)
MLGATNNVEESEKTFRKARDFAVMSDDRQVLENVESLIREAREKLKKSG